MRRPKQRSHGFTLIELLVAMALGLFLLGGLVSIFTSNQSNFKANEELARIQENSRFAFEILGREIRDAGLNPCGVKTINSVIKNPATNFYADWNSGTLQGIAATQTHAGVTVGTSTNERITNTAALLIIRTNSDENNLRVITSHDLANKQFNIASSSPALADKNLVMVCDQKSGVILELDGGSTTSGTYSNTDTVAASYNCSGRFDWKLGVSCSDQGGTKTFAAGAYLTKMDSSLWYIGKGSNGNNALYKIVAKDSRSTEAREVVSDVDDMQIEYLTQFTLKPGDIDSVPQVSPTAWITASNAVFSTANQGWTESNLHTPIAVRITLTFKAQETKDDAQNLMTRQAVGVFSLRNREARR